MYFKLASAIFWGGCFVLVLPVWILAAGEKTSKKRLSLALVVAITIFVTYMAMMLILPIDYLAFLGSIVLGSILVCKTLQDSLLITVPLVTLVIVLQIIGTVIFSVHFTRPFPIIM